MISLTLLQNVIFQKDDFKLGNKMRLISTVLMIFCNLNIFTAQEPSSLLMSYIRSHVNSDNYSASDVDDLIITHSHMSNVSMIKHYYISQRYRGVKINGAVMSVHLRQDNSLVKINNQLIRDVSEKLETSIELVSQKTAINLFLKQQGLSMILDNDPIESFDTAEKKHIYSDKDISLEKIPVYLIYQLNSRDKLRLCWEFNILPPDQSAWWNVRVDIETGEILAVENWMISCNFGHRDERAQCLNKMHRHHISTEELSPSVVLSPIDGSSYRVFPLGIESPAHGQRILVSNPADSLASPFGWHDTNGMPGAEYTTTRGNNVLAQEDIAGLNDNGQQAQGGSNLIFDFPLNLNTHPHLSQNASITNLFYWNNVIHDIIYHYGFTEAAGNFQQNNYDRGGIEGDYVIADAMDGSGTNNANFSTPSDGSNPRMQMFLWTTAPDAVYFNVDSPANIAADYDVVKADFGPRAYLASGVVVASDPILACGSLNNSIELNGKVAMVDLGACQPATKCLNVQNAGAIAALVCNDNSNPPFIMPPGANGSQVTIPSVMLAKSTCDSIKANLPDVQVTLLGYAGQPIDSDFDNLIIGHEYGHGISTRLTGGASVVNCLFNQEQMGEGWSDWYGLMITMKPTDTPTMPRGVGSYVMGQANDGQGIRPYRYSTDFDINPHTYADISSAAVPHGVGAVWCAMLWDLTWDLIDLYGFDSDLYTGNGGNNVALTLVTEALKLQPCNPGFVDGRDAILLADRLIYDGIHECLIWKAFSRRGLGLSANQGSTSSNNDGTEAFDVPVPCSIEFQKMADKPYAAPGDTINYEIRVVNVHSSNISNLILKDTLSSNTFYVQGSASDGGSFQNGVVSFPAFVLTVGDTIIRRFSVVLDPQQSTTQYDWSDGAEIQNRRWKRSSTTNQSVNWVRTQGGARTGSFCWFAQNVAFLNTSYLTLDTVALVGSNSTFSFWHRYALELQKDGGRLEISTDNGDSWQDLGQYITQNPYNSYTDNDPSRPAFSGVSSGYIKTIIDLSSFEGKFVKIRFSLYNNEAGAMSGWFVDDIYFENLLPIVQNEANLTSPNTDLYIQTELTQAVIIKPCTLVWCEANSGKGTLRRAVQCASPGDTVAFLEPVWYKNIHLLSPIVINKDINILHPSIGEINISITNAQSPIFTISSGSQVLLDNLILNTSGTGISRAIVNHGLLNINTLLIRDENNMDTGSIIENFGSLNVIGSLLIQKE